MDPATGAMYTLKPDELSINLVSSAVALTPEELKAWSQNLGHEDVMTTLRSYGEVPSPRQAEIIRNLHQASEPDMDAAAALKALETIVRRTTSGSLR